VRITKKKLHDAWRNFIFSAVGNLLESDQLIFSDESGPRPPKPYITMKIITGPTPNGFDTLSFVGAEALPSENVKFELEGSRQYALSLQSFSSKLDPEKSHDLMELIVSQLENPMLAQKLREDADIAIKNRGAPADITVGLETTFERRTVLTIDFGSTQAIDINPSAVEKVSVGGTLKTANANEIVVPPPRGGGALVTS